METISQIDRVNDITRSMHEVAAGLVQSPDTDRDIALRAEMRRLLKRYMVEVLYLGGKMIDDTWAQARNECNTEIAELAHAFACGLERATEALAELDVDTLEQLDSVRRVLREI